MNNDFKKIGKVNIKNQIDNSFLGYPQSQQNGFSLRMGNSLLGHNVVLIIIILVIALSFITGYFLNGYFLRKDDSSEKQQVVNDTSQSINNAHINTTPQVNVDSLQIKNEQDIYINLIASYEMSIDKKDENKVKQFVEEGPSLELAKGKITMFTKNKATTKYRGCVINCVKNNEKNNDLIDIQVYEIIDEIENPTVSLSTRIYLRSYTIKRSDTGYKIVEFGGHDDLVNFSKYKISLKMK